MASRLKTFIPACHAKKKKRRPQEKKIEQSVFIYFLNTKLKNILAYPFLTHVNRAMMYE